MPFFVYGTLLPNQPNFFLWESDIVGMEFASFDGGQLYDMGHYPMAVAARGQTIVGMMMTVDGKAYKTIRQRLDELEGFNPAQPEASAYRRQSVWVSLANGRLHQAWIYMGQKQYVVDKPTVPSGDWAAYAAKKQIGLDDWWRNVNSVAGLH